MKRKINVWTENNWIYIAVIITTLLFIALYKPELWIKYIPVK
jgi:hypothetical protein